MSEHRLRALYAQEPQESKPWVFVAAAHWSERAADRGYAWAQYNLGHLSLDGRGRRNGGRFATARRTPARSGADMSGQP
jgi:TPR repeat protein